MLLFSGVPGATFIDVFMHLLVFFLAATFVSSMLSLSFSLLFLLERERSMLKCMKTVLLR